MKKTLVYGIGSLGQCITNRDKYHVAGYIETAKTTKTFCGRPVYSVSEIKNIGYDEIIVANTHLETIKNLLSAGVDKSKIILIHPLLVEIYRNYNNGVMDLQTDIFRAKGAITVPQKPYAVDMKTDAEPYAWERPEDLFAALNENCQYVVMRNYENYFAELSMPGHADIDILCSDRQKATEVAGVVRQSPYNPFHCKVNINDKLVAFDIYSPGDGYYDETWQRDILTRCQEKNLGFYVMEENDYLFSLIYHVLYHKRDIADDYRNRLAQMLSDGSKTVASMAERLELFMLGNGYKYTACHDYRYILEKKLSLLPPERVVAISDG